MEKIDPILWDGVRSDILRNATSLFKAQTRFGLTDYEVEKMKAEIGILRTPPPYQEALEFIRARAGKIKEKS